MITLTVDEDRLISFGGGRRYGDAEMRSERRVCLVERSIRGDSAILSLRLMAIKGSGFRVLFGPPFMAPPPGGAALPTRLCVTTMSTHLCLRHANQQCVG